MKTQKLIVIDTVKTSRKIQEESSTPPDQADAISVAIHDTVAGATASVNDNIDQLRQETQDGLKAVRDEANDRSDRSDDKNAAEFKAVRDEIKDGLKAVRDEAKENTESLGERIDRSDDKNAAEFKAVRDEANDRSDRSDDKNAAEFKAVRDEIKENTESLGARIDKSNATTLKLLIWTVGLMVVTLSGMLYAVARAL